MSYLQYEELDLQVLPHTIKRLKDDLEPDVKHHIYQHFINTSDSNEACRTAYENFWMQMHAIIPKYYKLRPSMVEYNVCPNLMECNVTTRTNKAHPSTNLLGIS
ncbi:hypothetical protein DFH28DRAFT_924534 [Melampsora americana]|nr:hypothetical protein DFH28DRAFT_924534 [Melampsora americana]